MIDAVSGSTGGNLNLAQHARAGDGGFANILTIPGMAGNASSSLTAGNPGGGSLAGTSFASGGIGGGANEGAAGSAGGDATAAVNLTGSGDVTAQAEAFGGRGGRASEIGDAGNGGNASLGTVRAASSGGGAVHVAGVVEGGTGGAGESVFSVGTANGGDGASVSLTDSVDGFTTGDLILRQSARGGRGGSAEDDGTNGLAGSAFSSLTRSKSSASLVVSTEALGGSGGSRTSTAGMAGSGASGIAISTAINNGGSTQAEARATGGSGGFVQGGAIGGAGGSANANASSTSIGGFPAMAIAEAFGGSGPQGDLHGSAVAHAESSGVSGEASTLAQSGNRYETDGSIARQVSASAIAPVASTSVSESRTAVGELAPDPIIAVGLQSAAFATALPSDVDSQAALEDNPNVDLNFDVGGTSDMLGLVVLGGAYSQNGSGILQTYTSNAAFVLDMTSLLGNSQDLLVGLLDPTALGVGFDTLMFQIEIEGSTVIDEMFTDLGDALTYFDDQTLNLGTWADWISDDNIMDVAFALSLTTDDLGAGFSSDLIFGNSTVIPLPPAILLFGTGLLGLVAIARRKRAA
jgi:hypothetical protein